MNILNLIGRKNNLFEKDIIQLNQTLCEEISNSSFLILGGAGTIGQAVVKEIFSRSPKKLHVVDISENNLVELVRDIRSSYGYIAGDFQTFALDISTPEYDYFIEKDGNYKYVLNLSALKHVRSEKDPFTLMRMVRVNILNTIKTIEQSISKGTEKYFCVSTDKAANPVNLMGASKRIMEMFLFKYSDKIKISTARFANVAFSDGSLLHGFNQRIIKKQPIVAPNDVKRYFVTPKESGELCLLSCIFGKTGDIFFPKLSEELHLVSFSEIALKYLQDLNLNPIICESENEARELFFDEKKEWPCLFSPSNTTGEKDFEEFYTENEIIDFDTFQNIGIVKNEYNIDPLSLDNFHEEILQYLSNKNWGKKEIVKLFEGLIPNMEYEDKEKYLDSKM
jgi:FlaA1/EpsC-like NDP-sugar epimerase